MARILIVGGDERGVRLARALIEQGHVVRLVTEDPERRPGIEALGAECLLGTPERLSTLRGALEHVAVACWLFAMAPAPLAAAVHGSRLEQFLFGAVDTTLRGFVYETGGGTPPAAVRQGQEVVAEIGSRNAMPIALLSADPHDDEAWLVQAVGAVERLLTAG
jgi:hypothetical protein